MTCWFELALDNGVALLFMIIIKKLVDEKGINYRSYWAGRRLSC